jgi:hypothetical protein
MVDMVDENELQEANPLLQPRLVRFLQRRPKLFDIDARDKMLEEIEKEICIRRDPEQVSSTVSKMMVRSGEKPVREAAKTTLQNANEKALRNL